MVYGKEYKILKNFEEYDDEEQFEAELFKLAKGSAVFIDGIEQK